MQTPPDLHPDLSHILIDETSLQARITELGAQINADYSKQGAGQLVLVAVLRGAYMFLADLSRAITRDHRIDFMAVSSYGASARSTGVVRIILDMERAIAGEHVLIIEDIIDSGYTLSYLRRILLDRNPASLRICTLLNKPARRIVSVPVDYIGFDIPDQFVIGYGLDFAERYRNLPYIGVLKPELYM